MKRKIGIGVIAIILVVTAGIVLFNTEFKRENVNISKNTISQLVYADAMNVDSIEAEVVFTVSDNVIDAEKKASTFENALQDAYTNAFIERVVEEQNRIDEERYRREEEERRRKEAEQKAAELAAYRAEVGDTYNPFVKSGMTAEQFNIMLAGSGLAGCGESYYNMEQNYNVNGVFAIGVAFHESGYGRYKANTNNFYGMRGNSGWMAFESPDANIQYFGKLMNQSLYYGKSIDSIGAIYCPGTSASWASAVRGMMSSCYNKVK